MFSHRMVAAALEASIKTNSGYSGWPDFNKDDIFSQSITLAAVLDNCIPDHVA